MSGSWIETRIHIDADMIVCIEPNDTMDAVDLIIRQPNGAECSRVTLDKSDSETLSTEIIKYSNTYCDKSKKD